MCCSPRGHKELDTLGQLNNYNINTGVHISFQIRVFFFRPIPRNGIAWSYSNSILSFSRNFHFYFPQFLYQFIFPSTLHRVSFPPYSCQHLLLVFFLMVGILTGMRWCFLVVLVCISLMIRRRWACIHVPIKLLHHDGLKVQSPQLSGRSTWATLKSCWGCGATGTLLLS